MKRDVLQQQWRRVSAWVAGRSLRERGILAGTLLVLVWFGWDLAIKSGHDARMEALESQREVVRSTVERMEENVEGMREELARPDSDDRDGAVRALRAAIERSNERLAQRAQQLIEPGQMVAVLHGMLVSEGDLTLENLINLEPERVVEEGEAPVFRHPVEVTVSGRYLALLAYLQRLQDTGWALQWERLEIVTQEQPHMRAVFRVSTLSLAEEWIGV